MLTEWFFACVQVNHARRISSHVEMVCALTTAGRVMGKMTVVTGLMNLTAVSRDEFYRIINKFKK